MREKRDSLWRCIRTFLLLVSAITVLFGCASRNPLIDEDSPVDDDKAVIAAIEADEQKLREQQSLEARQEKERIQAEANRRAAARTQTETRRDEPVLPSGKAVPEKQPLEKGSQDVVTKAVEPVVPASVPAVPERAGAIVRPAEPKQVNTEIPEVKEVNVSAQENVSVPEERKSLEIVPEFHVPERRPITYSAYGNVDRGEKEEVLLNSPPRPVKKWMIFFTPYRVNEQQGNFISAEMLSRLQPGMTKDQVRFALGTPLLMDIFHANRWDYPFRLLKRNGALTTYRVAIFFNQDGVVESVKHDSLPDEVEYLNQIASDEDSADKPKKDKLATTDHHMSGNFQPGSSPTPLEAGAADAPSPEELERQLPAIAPVRTTGGDPDAHKPDYVPGRVSKTGKLSRPLPGVKSAASQAWTPKDATIAVPEIKGEDGPEQVVDYQSLPSYRTGTYGGGQPGGLRPISAFRPSTVQEPIEGAVSEEKRSEWMANRDAMLRALHAYDEAESDDIKNLTYDSIKKFESISIPRRTDKMVPESPNLKQIGNIQ